MRCASQEPAAPAPAAGPAPGPGPYYRAEKLLNVLKRGQPAGLAARLSITHRTRQAIRRPHPWPEMTARHRLSPAPGNEEM